MKSDDKKYIQQAIEFAKAKNHLWPFACLITNEEGIILCKATDCAHISPLFHAEALTIHALIMKKDKPQLGKLSLYSTAEPDVLSQSAIHWAKIAHDLENVFILEVRFLLFKVFGRLELIFLHKKSLSDLA